MIRRLAATFALVATASACAGASARGARGVADADRMRDALSQDTQTLAPEVTLAAHQALTQAKQAAASGDAIGAELHAERAIALYSHATAVARLQRATREEVAAGRELAASSEQARRDSAQRHEIDREANDLEKSLRIAREAQLPSPSGPTDPDRQRARVIAAQSLVTQARLLCSAARLVAPQAPGLTDAEGTVATLEKQGAALSIDPSARARAACLASLTRARRTTSGVENSSDALLAELSRTFDAKAADLAPSRDERGVIVTLRGAFNQDALRPEIEASLKDLARVASAHPTFAVQIVLHDAVAPGPRESRINQKRGEAIARALRDGGASTTRVKVEQAGASAPIADPKDARARERNARIEFVFVAPGQ